MGALTGSTTQFFLTDLLGSVLTTFTTTANTAAVQGNQLYGPYGNNRYSQGSMGTNKGFTGHYADATGLDYYNARYYDPVAGRFLSADVVQGDLQGMDPYDYVGGNPETVTDPTGQRYIQNTGGGDPVSDPGSGGGVSGGACKSYIADRSRVNVASISSYAISVLLFILCINRAISSDQCARRARRGIFDSWSMMRARNVFQRVPIPSIPCLFQGLSASAFCLCYTLADRPSKAVSSGRIVERQP